MRAVVQRVSRAAVTVEGRVVGVCESDIEAEAQWLANKIVMLRIFDDDAGKLNRSVLDIKGSALVVSQL